MEDAHTTVPVVPGMDKCSFYAVFDGHCGPTIAKYSSENLLMEFLKHPDLSAFVNSGNKTNIDPEAVGKVMKEGFVILDDYMKTVPPWKNGEDQSGSTAVCALVTPTHIICANCGDSRAIFSRQGDLGLVTRDHKPTNDDEKCRIEKAGGSVIMHRVNGSLAVSRALGDYEYKTSTNMPSIEQQVSPLPEIFTLERDNDKDEFLLIACDGIWDVMSNQESIEYIHRELQIRDDLGQICANLLEECLQRGSRDNMSAVLVTFPAAPEVNEEARLKDEEERRKIAAITEKIEEEVKRLFVENNAVSVAHACGSVDTMLESCEPEGAQLRIPRRRIVENKLLDLRENEYSTQPSAPEQNNAVDSNQVNDGNTVETTPPAAEEKSEET